MTASASDLYDLIQWTTTTGVNDLKMLGIGIVIGVVLAGIALWK